jgi:hypothetical protein
MLARFRYVRISSRSLAVGLAIGALAVAGLVASHLRMLGFPDGYVTARERAMRPLEHVVLWASVLASVAGARLAWIGGARDVTRSLARAATVYLGVIIVVAAIALVLLPPLDDGTGG